MIDGKMHQTTVRFSPDLWAAMEQECGRLGVSAAQYLREAALARLAYSAGTGGLPRYEDALAGRVAETLPAFALAPDGSQLSQESVSDATALTAQSRLARTRSREIREQSAELRRDRVRVAR
jgi:hypothetical protein